MKWSLNQAAQEWRIDRRTLEKRLKRAGITVRAKAKYDTRTISNAIVGDLEAQRIRIATTQANTAELEARRLAGDLIETVEVRRIYSEALLPIRQRLLALPNECATRANPTDPQFARDALQRWVDESLPMIREQI